MVEGWMFHVHDSGVVLSIQGFLGCEQPTHHIS